MGIGSYFSTLITELEDNLQLMGISDAEYDSTTGIRGLVARIPEIQPSNDGLLFWTDKNVIQSGSTVNLSALLLNNGLGVSGESVIFESNEPIDTITVSPAHNFTVNSDYITFNISSMSQGAGLMIGSPSTLIGIYMTENDIECYGFNNNMYDDLGDTNIQIKDKILTYDSSENGLTNIDISEIAYEIYPDDDLTVYEYFYDKVNTNSNGIASTTYTGTGLDSVGFHAESNGIVSQNIYVTTPKLKLNVVWDDNNDSAGARPSTVTYQILKDGVVINDGNLSASDNWSKTFDDITIIPNSTYNIRLPGIPAYAASIVEDPDYTFTITNSYLSPGAPPTSTGDDDTLPTPSTPSDIPPRG